MRFLGEDSGMDDVVTQAPLISPCISICQMDADKGLCLGCYRTRCEIAAWPGMSANEQGVLLIKLQARRSAATGTRPRPSRSITQS